MNIRLLIADSDERYLSKLDTILCKSSELTISQYSDKHKLKEALDKKTFDAVLFSHDMYVENLSNARVAIYLATTNDAPTFSTNDYHMIRKYQRISNIIREVYEYYAEVAPSKNIFAANASAITCCVYAPTGGCGVTSTALAIVKELNRNGKRALYVSLEQFSCLKGILGANTNKGIEELIARMEIGNFDVYLKSFLNEEQGITYINGFSNIRDTEGLDSNEIEMLIQKMSNTELFDVVVIDTDSIWNDKIRQVFTLVDFAILLSTSSETSTIKLEQLLGNAAFQKEYKEKVRIVTNMCKQSVKQIATYTPTSQVGVILAQTPYDVIDKLAQNLDVTQLLRG